MRKKSLAVLLALAMLLGLFPATALADEPGTEEPPQTVETAESETFTVDTSDANLADNDELFTQYLQELLYPSPTMSLFANFGETALTGLDLAVYNDLKSFAESVAGGSQSSTQNHTFELNTLDSTLQQQATWKYADLGIGDSFEKSEPDAAAPTDDETAVDTQFAVKFDIRTIINHLLADCPDTFYWYDKTYQDKDNNIGALRYSYGYSYDDDAQTVTITSLTFSFVVAEDYRNSGSLYEVNHSKILAAQAALAKVKDTLDKYQGQSTYDILKGYKDEICVLVEYDTESANNKQTPYGDPWQIISVFDGDKSTNVVCEGYAKAFQYLCSQTNFSDGTACYTVTGDMEVTGDGGTAGDSGDVATGGGHMWNIIRTNGQSYLVDVTNCDGEDGASSVAVGYPDNLFLKAPDPNGSVQTGYTFTIGQQKVTYRYDNGIPTAEGASTPNIIGMYGEAILTLADSAYPLPGLSLSYTAPGSLTVDTPITDMTPSVSGGSGNYTYVLDGSTLPDGLNLNSTTGVISGTPTTATESPTSVTIKVTDSQGRTGTYTITFPAVGKQANTMTSVTQGDVEYGTAVSPSAESNGNPPTFWYKVKGADDSTYTDTAPTAVGEYTVKASSTGHATVADATVTADFQITPKTLTDIGVTNITVTKTYDGTTDPGTLSGTVAFAGKVDGDDISITAVAGDYADKNAGTSKTVKLTLSLAGADAGNYQLESNEIALTTAEITTADYTYTVPAVQDFRVGSGLSAITVAPEAGTGENGESVAGTLRWYADNQYTTAAQDTDLSKLSVSEMVTLYWQFTATDSNYTNTAKQGSTTFTAKDKTSLTITGVQMGASSYVYGDTVTYDKSGLSVSGATTPAFDEATLEYIYAGTPTDGTAFTSGTAAPTKPGSYTLTVQVPDSNADYMGEQVISFTIEPKVLTRSDLEYTGSITKVYDGNTNAVGITVTVKSASLVDSNDTVTVTGSAAYNSANVSEANSITFTPNAITSGNYTLAASETLVISGASITSKPITIASVTAADRAYEADNRTVDVTVTFSETGITESDYTVTGTMDTPDAGPDKTVTVTVTWKNSNYSLAVNTTTITVNINKIAWTGGNTATGFAKYGSTGTVDLSALIAPGGTASYESMTDTSSVVSGTPSVIGNTLSFIFVNDSGKAGSTAQIVVNVEGATNYNNYTITVMVTMLDKLPQSDFGFAAPTQTKTYGDADFTVTASGAVSGSTVSYESSASDVATVDPDTGKVHILKAGTTTITATAAATGDYAEATAQYELTVSKATVTVKAVNQSIYVNGTVPDLSSPVKGTHYTVTGLVGSDELTGTLAMEYQQNGSPVTPDASKTGTYDIVISGVSAPDDGNYNTIVIEKGTLTIAEKSTTPVTPVEPGGGSSSGGSSSGGSSSGGSSSGSSTSEKNPDGSTTTTTTSSNGTVTETTRYPDGSKEVVETKKDGTVTTTTTDKAGNETKVVENPNGSTETTVDNRDGSSSTTTVSRSGQVEASVKLPLSAIENAADADEPVALPMPELPVTTSRSAAPTVTMDLPAGRSARVEIPVENVTAGTVAILVKADGSEQIVKTSVTTDNGVTVTLSDGDTVKIVDNSKSFTDVSNSYWAADAIDFATSRELFAGNTDTTFNPAGTMTRAMIWTVLARYDGTDTTSAAGAWYVPGQTWAMDSGISDGSNPNGTMTREQLATMLYRYAQSKGLGFDGTWTFPLDYPDAASVSSYAREALSWMTMHGIIGGMSDGTLNPQGSATRAQVATILQRFVTVVNG